MPTAQSGDQPSKARISELENLSNACIEAAGRCLEILEAMKDQELIGMDSFLGQSSSEVANPPASNLWLLRP